MIRRLRRLARSAPRTPTDFLILAGQAVLLAFVAGGVAVLGALPVWLWVTL